MWVYGLFPGAENAHRIADMEYRFCLEAMAIMDIPTFVRGRDTPTLGIWGFLRAGQAATPTGLVGGVESVSGIPRSLLDIIARIGSVSAEEEFSAWPGHEGSIPHCHLWEAFRLAGILLNRRKNRSPATSPTNEVIVCRLVATLDALYETRCRDEYSHILATSTATFSRQTASCILTRQRVWKCRSCANDHRGCRGYVDAVISATHTATRPTRSSWRRFWTVRSKLAITMLTSTNKPSSEALNSPCSNSTCYAVLGWSTRSQWECMKLILPWGVWMVSLG